MDDEAEKLRGCIARFECYLAQGVTPSLAAVYLAEIAAWRTMQEALERRTEGTSQKLAA